MERWEIVIKKVNKEKKNYENFFEIVKLENETIISEIVFVFGNGPWMTI